MMSSPKTGLAKKLALAVSITSILAFLFIYPRQVELIILFARFELITDYIWLLAPVAGVLVVIVGEHLALKRYPDANRPTSAFGRWLRLSRWSPVIALLLVVFAGMYVRLQYRIFSELYYQERALDAVRNRKMLQARLTCQEYVRLYPQRSETGALPDKVCTSILEFTTEASALEDYVSRQKANLREVNGVVLPAAPAAKEETLRIVKCFTTDAAQ